MELSIASRGSTKPPIPEENRREVSRNDRNAKVSLKDPMVVNTAEVKVQEEEQMQMKNDLKNGKRTRCVI